MEKLKEILAEILNERLRDMTISSVMDKQNTVKKNENSASENQRHFIYAGCAL